MTWHPVANFSAAEELLQDPGLKVVLKAALDNGFAVVSRARTSCTATAIFSAVEGIQPPGPVRTTYLLLRYPKSPAGKTSSAGG
jgi:hypothetical protein